MRLNYAPGPASLVRCVVCGELQEVEPLQPLVPLPQPVPPPPPRAVVGPPTVVGPPPGAPGHSTDSPPASTPSPPSTAPTATPAVGASAAVSPVRLQFPVSPEPSLPPLPPAPVAVGGGYEDQVPATPLGGPPALYLYGIQPAVGEGGQLTSSYAAQGGFPPGLRGGHGGVGAPWGVPSHSPYPFLAGPRGPTPYLPLQQPLLPSMSPPGQLPLPPYPLPILPGAYPSNYPLYWASGGGVGGGASPWHAHPQLSLHYPPPAGGGDWRASSPGFYPAAPPLVGGGGGIGGGESGGGTAPWGQPPLPPSLPPPSPPPWSASEGPPPPARAPTPETRQAQLEQLEDGDLPSSAAALQRRLEILHVGQGATVGAVAAPPLSDGGQQRLARDSGPAGASEEVTDEPSLGGGGQTDSVGEAGVQPQPGSVDVPDEMPLTEGGGAPAPTPSMPLVVTDPSVSAAVAAPFPAGASPALLEEEAEQEQEGGAPPTSLATGVVESLPLGADASCSLDGDRLQVSMSPGEDPGKAEHVSPEAADGGRPAKGRLAEDPPPGGDPGAIERVPIGATGGGSPAGGRLSSDPPRGGGTAAGGGPRGPKEIDSSPLQGDAPAPPPRPLVGQ